MNEEFDYDDFDGEGRYDGLGSVHPDLETREGCPGFVYHASRGCFHLDGQTCSWEGKRTSFCNQLDTIDSLMQ